MQERLGHSTVNITLNVYSHVSPTMHAEAANLIADLFLGEWADDDEAEGETDGA